MGCNMSSTVQPHALIQLSTNSLPPLQPDTREESLLKERLKGCTERGAWAEADQIMKELRQIQMPNADIGTERSSQLILHGRLNVYALLGGDILDDESSTVVRPAKVLSTGKIHTVKCIVRKSVDKHKEAGIRNGVAILSELTYHPNIVSLVEFIEDGVYFYMISEKIWGGELYHRLAKRSQYSEYF